jgi:uncharacterized membrane protein YraQ (UPF0718 family)
MTQAVKKNGVSFGVVLGIFSVLTTSVIYAIDLSLFASFWLGIILFIIYLTIGIVAVAKSKKALGGYISFREAFTTFFITMLIGLIINMIFSFLLFNVIDPQAAETIKEHIVELTVSMGQKFGTPADQLKEQIKQIQESESYSLVSQLKTFFGMLLFYIIIGLIVAAAMKKNKPEFE